MLHTWVSQPPPRAAVQPPAEAAKQSGTDQLAAEILLIAVEIGSSFEVVRNPENFERQLSWSPTSKAHGPYGAVYIPIRALYELGLNISRV